MNGNPMLSKLDDLASKGWDLLTHSVLLLLGEDGWSEASGRLTVIIQHAMRVHV